MDKTLASSHKKISPFQTHNAGYFKETDASPVNIKSCFNKKLNPNPVLRTLEAPRRFSITVEKSPVYHKQAVIKR